ncbi:EAL domain-containing protein [Candidatus Accumulibacter aalborgensis]|uniref:EAL domain-containing protein n=1 Tax=Candidatus Accumulibacter aalborgensis TaxID=1860102 RepID=UPI00164689C8|nr:EAL domain-containing protein [Candidatus Accumulibacter aalborgensis]
MRAPASEQPPPAVLRVAIDDNYPPYVFRDGSGRLMGYLVDSWKLWERKTGVRVELLGSDWSTAQQRMANREVEVLDTAFRTPERERLLDFSAPYEPIPVSIYTHSSIGGIVDLDTLHGFLVGVKAGDACVEELAAAGIDTVQLFASYQALVRGAVEGRVRVFCLDEPPANYLLYLNSAEQWFNKAFTLYSGEFHRAVHKGDAATLALLQRGFTEITAGEEKALREKWMGIPFALSPHTRYLGYALLVGSLVGALLLIWVVTLRRVVRQRTAKLEATLAAIPDLMFELGLDGRYHDYHSPRTDLLAAPPEVLLGKRVSDVLPPDAAAVCLSALQEALTTGHSVGRQFELPLAHGRFWFELSVARKPAKVGDETRFVVISRDITERKRVEEALRASEALKASVLASAACGIVATDRQGLITVFNPGAEAIFGYCADEVVGRVTPTLFHDHDELAAIAEAQSEALGYPVEVGFDALVVRARTTGATDEREMIGIRKDGRRISVRISVTVMCDAQGELAGYLGTLIDMTEHKEAEASIQRLAHFDSLTGLPNRTLLNERVRHDLARAHRGHESLALIFLDLDRFKNVNDSLGHRIGDDLLVQLAGRLKRAVRDDDTVSRLGGDEFVLLLPNTDADGAAHVATKLLEVTAPPYCIEQHELVCTVSLGIALYPADGDTFEALSRCADTAMYRAKQRGRNAYCFFTAEMQERSTRMLQIENELRRAVVHGELRLHYQPQFALVGRRRLIGAEALLRWQHPELGMISPAEFIPIAEECGLILSIGEWVLRTAVLQMRLWQQAGLPPITVAVNLSAVQFRQANLTEWVSRILDEEELPAEYLELELTESVAMDNPLAAIETMDRLRRRGVRMSIDDFGTGYSSMSYLKRFRVHKLKIDRSFVADLAADPDDAAIVAATIGLAHNLGLQTIAEGVESEAQLAFLCAKGCDEGQGYLFSPPLPAPQFEAFVRDGWLV